MVKKSTLKKIIHGFFAVAAAVFLVACTSQTPTGDVIKNPPNEQQTTTQVIVKAAQTKLGNILVDNNGMTLYLFRSDTNGESTCYGTCATYWPPLLVDDNVIPTGIRTSAIFDTVERTDETYQVRANGMPLYYFAGDKSPGDVNGQGSNGSGGLWYVLSPDGNEITTSLDSLTSSTQETQKSEDENTKISANLLKTSKSTYGDIIIDSKGMTLYAFDDELGSSKCYDLCAEYWPPLTVDDEDIKVTGTGITGTLGVIERTDGTYQITINNMPLYYYSQDKKAGDMTGQGLKGFGYLWYTVTPDGDKIKSIPQPQSTTKVAVMTSSSKYGDILVDTNGMTLYEFTQDSIGESTCTGTCAANWPPLLLPKGSSPTGQNTALTLELIERADGTYQVTANGMPLYYYVGDTKIGDTNGQGLNEKWYIIAPNGRMIGKPSTIASSSSSPSVGSSGY